MPRQEREVSEPINQQLTCGWFKASRSRDALELIRKNPRAYALAAAIAHRTRWSDGYHADGLERGEALIGDYAEIGMTRQQYRTALKHLVDGNFVTIKTTSRGTIAKLTDTRLFDPLNLVCNQQNDQQLTNNQPTVNHHATTNEKRKKEEKEINSESNTSAVIKDLQPALTQLMTDAREILGLDEMKRCHKRWLRRAETEPERLRRVLDDMRATMSERAITKPGAYAEDLWKRFAPAPARPLPRSHRGGDQVFCSGPLRDQRNGVLVGSTDGHAR